MIIGFVGRMGSGKTLSMTRCLLKYYQRGFRILTNYDLAIPHEEVSFEWIIKTAEEQGKLDMCVLALDEIHIMIDSRAAPTKRNRSLSYLLNQSRKLKVIWLYSTQYAHQVDKRLRSGTDLWVMCEGTHVLTPTEDLFIVSNYITDGTKNREEVFLGNNYFHLYNTNQVIRFSGVE